MDKTILYLLTLLTLTVTLPAKMVDGIALIVEGEAVTIAEIRAVRTQFGISKSEATDLLIQDRLQNAAMKDIKIPEEKIDSKIAEIGTQNSVTIPKMQKILQAQGTSWVQYRKSIRDALKKNKFYQDEVVASIPTPSEDELKMLYNKNKKSFTIPTSIKTTEYSASTQEKITKFIKTHKKSLVTSRKITHSTLKLEPTLLTILLQSPNGKYTSSINAGDKYIVYLIHSKKGKTIMPFKAAKGAVTAKWKQEQQTKALKDYFEKMRTRADVQILR